MEQSEYNILYRWFSGLDMDEPVWDPPGSAVEDDFDGAHVDGESNGLRWIAGLRKNKHRGRKRVGRMFTFAAAAYNLFACATSRARLPAGGRKFSPSSFRRSGGRNSGSKDEIGSHFPRKAFSAASLENLLRPTESAGDSMTETPSCSSLLR